MGVTRETRQAETLVAETEGKVVLDCRDLVELAELGETLPNFFVPRVSLVNAKVEQDATCAL